MTSEPDHYTVLGMAPRTDIAAVREQYRRLAKVFHPDRNDADPWCQEQLKRINGAYEFLADPARKSAYDVRYRPTAPTPAAASVAPRVDVPPRPAPNTPPLGLRATAGPTPVRRGRRAPSAVSLILLSACVALLLLGGGILQALDPAVLSAFWSPGEPVHSFGPGGSGDAAGPDVTYYTVPVDVVPPPVPAVSPAPAAPDPAPPHANPFASQVSDAAPAASPTSPP